MPMLSHILMYIVIHSCPADSDTKLFEHAINLNSLQHKINVEISADQTVISGEKFAGYYLHVT